MNAGLDIHKDAENKASTDELPRRFDHNFLVSVQTSQEVQAVELSKLISALNDVGIAGVITYVGTIDYGS